MASASPTPSVPSKPVRTTKVVGRRKVRFENLDEIIADAEMLAAKRVRQLGNWSVGQATGHLARTMQLSLDGFDGALAPLPFRLLMKIAKRPLLRYGFRPGFKLPSPIAEKAILEPSFTNEQGLGELRTNIKRLKHEPQRAVHPAFGRLTKEEWNRVHLRHAELHLSFFVPE
jgi:hypothetical protein